MRELIMVDITPVAGPDPVTHTDCIGGIRPGAGQDGGTAAPTGPNVSVDAHKPWWRSAAACTG